MNRSNRKELVDAAHTIERLLDAYELAPAALTGEVPFQLVDAAIVKTLTPVVEQVLATHDVDVADVVAYLSAPTGDTVADLVDLADQLLVGETRATYMSKLRFFSDGWRILPSDLDDAIAAAAKAELRIELSADPADYPTVELPVPGGKRIETYLVLWPGYGDQPIDRVRRSKIELAGKYKRADTLTRVVRRDRKRAERGEPPLGWKGNGAVEGLYAALSYLYGLARGEGIVDSTVNPLEDISSPKRDEGNRRPQSREEIDSLWRTVILHGSDSALDRLLIKFFFHTGGRREGAINLTLGRLNWERQSVVLLQKYGKETEVPVCRTLLEELYAFAHSRGSVADDDPVFRVDKPTSTGELPALSDKHFDTLHTKIRANLAWARKEGWTVHWARHHAKAEIHDIGGPAVARAFIGHAPGHVTERYGKASFEHVAWAVSIRTGDPHPLAQKPWWLG